MHSYSRFLIFKGESEKKPFYSRSPSHKSRISTTPRVIDSPRIPFRFPAWDSLLPSSPPLFILTTPHHESASAEQSRYQRESSFYRIPSPRLLTRFQSLSPEEQRLFRLYGKMPNKKDVLQNKLKVSYMLPLPSPQTPTVACDNLLSSLPHPAVPRTF